MTVGEGIAVAAPGLVAAVVFGCLWVRQMAATSRAEEERDQMWDEYNGPTNPRPTGEWR